MIRLHGDNPEVKCDKNFTKKSILNVLRGYPIEEIQQLDAHVWLEIIKICKLPKQFSSFVIDNSQNSEARKEAYDKFIQKLTSGKSDQQIEKELNDEIEKQLNHINYDDTDTIKSPQTNHSSNDDDEENNELAVHLIKEMSITNKYVSDKDNGNSIDFIIDYYTAKWWNLVLKNKNSINVLKACDNDGNIIKQIKESFFKEYNAVISIAPDNSYKYKYQPSLMQKLMVYRVMNNKGYGNWCGTGAGKTNAVYLSIRATKSHIAVFVVPNDVIDSMYHVNEDGSVSGSIVDIYPDTNVFICGPNNIPTCNPNEYNILIFNYEKFHQAYTENMLWDLINKNCIDFVCLDEVHKAKVRNSNDPSQTNRNIQKLLVESRKRNSELRTVVMSGTPFVNNLTEVRSVLELMTGKEYPEIQNTTDLENVHNAYKALLLNGFRYVPQFNIKVNTQLPLINGNIIKEEVKRLMKSDPNIVDVEEKLVEFKLDYIADYLKKGTIIYTEYVNNGRITNIITDYIRKHTKYSVGTYTGENVDERFILKNQFIAGNLDILVCSSPINTGVDHLQDICGNMIILSLPWTHADYTQLIGRIYRQNSIFEGSSIDIVIPQIHITTDDGEDWCYDEYRKSIIDSKRSLGESVMDGSIKSVYNFDEKKLFNEIKNAFNAHCEIVCEEIERSDINPGELNYNEDYITKRESKLNEYNRKGRTMTSDNMHHYFLDNPEAHTEYHRLRNESMKEWGEIPYEWIASQITSTRKVIVDFGCGDDAHIAKLLPNNKVYSFDHVSHNKDVIACNMKDVSKYLQNNSVDIAIFSLSLWGDWKECLVEAYRVLDMNGSELYIAEPKDERDGENIIEAITKIGFKKAEIIRNTGKFVYIKAIK